MSIVGKSEVRVDAFDKATGRTKYYEDRMPSGALYARIKHSEMIEIFSNFLHHCSKMGILNCRKSRRIGPWQTQLRPVWGA